MKAYIKTRNEGTEAVELTVGIPFRGGSLSISMKYGKLSEAISFSTSPLAEEWKKCAREEEIPDDIAEKLYNMWAAEQALAEPKRILWSKRLDPKSPHQSYLVIILLHPSSRLRYTNLLASANVRIEHIMRPQDAASAMEFISFHKLNPCLLLIDDDLGHLADNNGLEIIKWARQTNPKLACILFTEDPQLQNDQRTLDYLEKHRIELVDRAYPERFLRALDKVLS